MTFDANRADLTIGIVGAGAMGRGIAQIAIAGGMTVLLHDTRDGAADEAIAFVGGMLARAVEKGKMDKAAADAAASRMKKAEALVNLATCHVIIEAIVEDLDVKKGLLRDLEGIVSGDCILASNTSSLSVTAIAAACDRPERVAGFHFFNPVPLMKLVEVIKGVLTDEWAADALHTIAGRMGHTAVRAADTPGFIVNHAGRGYGTEALRIVGESVTNFATVDRIMRETAGFRMGPFELLDLTALDVSHPVMESIYHQYYEEPRYRPSPITRQRLAAGLVGRKTGRGFYSYENGKAVTPAESPAPTQMPDSVWIDPTNPETREAIAAIVTKAGVPVDDEAQPGGRSLCIVLPLGKDATTTTMDLGLDPQRTVGVDTLFGLDRRRTLMKTPVTDPTMLASAHALLAADGTAVSIISDSAGFVAQRIIATIVNIACDMAQQGVAEPADIDRAVTLGLGYPKGPLAWGDALGADRILAILDAMVAFYGDPRYRASPWLKRRAIIGVSLLSPES
ncbi:MAG: 3-hydroxyacyl-CoA dehydrogenase [Rhodospirillales bacterium]|nr:3-hydroxyacyl-CoA dehydrogenase [Rhodospirillales bacterium]